jgi:hypothetical protein
MLGADITEHGAIVLPVEQNIRNRSTCPRLLNLSCRLLPFPIFLSEPLRL